MSKGHVLVREAMKPNPITISPNTSVSNAAKIMKEKGIGNCIIMDEKPIGIITESDILKKVVAQDLNAGHVKVEEIMQTPLIIIDPYVEIEDAMKTMIKCNIRRLPVIEKEELIGIITVKDILRLSPMLLEINREWCEINSRDETYFKKQIFSGKCEDCQSLSSNLKNIDGRLLCEDCIDALKYE